MWSLHSSLAMLLAAAGMVFALGHPTVPDALLSSELAACSAAAADDSCADPAEVDATGLLQIRSPTTPQAVDVPEIGIMNLFGYYYPTQPGDVNDVRTYCHVSPADVDTPYPKCSQPLAEGQYGAAFVALGEEDGPQFTFAVAEDAVHTSKDSTLFPIVRDALEYLLKKPEVKAITCNVGFCSELQPLAELAMNDLVRNKGLAAKPMLLGTPALLPMFSYTSSVPQLGLDAKTEGIIVVASYFPGLDQVNIVAILQDVGMLSGLDPGIKHTWVELNSILEDHLGIKCMDHTTACASIVLMLVRLNALAMARNIVVVGWNNQEGYIPVDSSAGFHNVNLTLETYKPFMQSAFDHVHKQGWKVKAIVMESTEMPAHSNKIRMDFETPVFDFSIVTKCLMRATPSFTTNHVYTISNLYDDPAWVHCLTDMFTPSFIEPLFGTQVDGSLKFYEGIPREEMKYLTCTGGRRPAPAESPGRLMQLYDQGHPFKVGQLNPICFLTALGRCSGVAANGIECPGLLIPGSGNCGGGSFGPQVNQKGLGYPCGPTGSLCKSWLDVPPLNRNFTADPSNSNACAVPVASSDFS